MRTSVVDDRGVIVDPGPGCSRCVRVETNGLADDRGVIETQVLPDERGVIVDTRMPWLMTPDSSPPEVSLST
jgi:hypothetical protein